MLLPFKVSKSGTKIIIWPSFCLNTLIHSLQLIFNWWGNVCKLTISNAGRSQLSLLFTQVKWFLETKKRRTTRSSAQRDIFLSLKKSLHIFAKQQQKTKLQIFVMEEGGGCPSPKRLKVIKCELIKKLRENCKGRERERLIKSIPPSLSLSD